MLTPIVTAARSFAEQQAWESTDAGQHEFNRQMYGDGNAKWSVSEISRPVRDYSHLPPTTWKEIPVQTSLFDADQLPPAAAHADPLTSHEAAAKVNESGDRAAQCQRVLAMVKQLPGATSKELAKRFKVDRHMVGRRLPDLRSMGLVKNGPARACKVNGNKAVTWEAV